MLYLHTISGVATKNLQKLFNSDTQASINYSTILSQFCTNWYVTTTKYIMHKTHNINHLKNNIYYCCNAYTLHP